MDEEFHLSIKNTPRRIGDVRDLFKDLTKFERETLETEKRRAEQNMLMMRRGANINKSVDNIYAVANAASSGQNNSNNKKKTNSLELESKTKKRAESRPGLREDARMGNQNLLPANKGVLKPNANILNSNPNKNSDKAKMLPGLKREKISSSSNSLDMSSNRFGDSDTRANKHSPALSPADKKIKLTNKKTEQPIKVRAQSSNQHLNTYLQLHEQQLIQNLVEGTPFGTCVFDRQLPIRFGKENKFSPEKKLMGLPAKYSYISDDIKKYLKDSDDDEDEDDDNDDDEDYDINTTMTSASDCNKCKRKYCLCPVVTRADDLAKKRKNSLDKYLYYYPEGQNPIQQLNGYSNLITKRIDKLTNNDAFYRANSMNVINNISSDANERYPVGFLNGAMQSNSTPASTRDKSRQQQYIHDQLYRENMIKSKFNSVFSTSEEYNLDKLISNQPPLIKTPPSNYVSHQKLQQNLQPQLPSYRQQVGPSLQQQQLQYKYISNQGGVKSSRSNAKSQELLTMPSELGSNMSPTSRNYSQAYYKPYEQWQRLDKQINDYNMGSNNDVFSAYSRFNQISGVTSKKYQPTAQPQQMPPFFNFQPLQPMSSSNYSRKISSYPNQQQHPLFSRPLKPHDGNSADSARLLSNPNLNLSSQVAKNNQLSSLLLYSKMNAFQ